MGDDLIRKAAKMVLWNVLVSKVCCKGMLFIRTLVVT